MSSIDLVILERYINYAIDHKKFFKDLSKKEEIDFERLLELEKTTEYYQYLGRDTILSDQKKRIYRQSSFEKATLMSLNTSVHFGVEVGVEESEEDSFRHFYHNHQFIELIYVYRGQYTHYIDGKKEQLKQGDLCLINPNCTHYDPLEPEDQIIYIGLPISLLTSDKYMLNEMNPDLKRFVLHSADKDTDMKEHINFYRKDGDNEEFIEYLELIAKEHYHKRIGHGYMMISLVLRFIELAFLSCETVYISQESKKVEKEFFKIIDKFCKENISSIHKKEVEEKCYLTSPQIDHILKHVVGTTYSQYIIRTKMELARELLMAGKLSIDKVMEQVGYANRTYFYKKFEEIYGLNPGEYKRSKKGYKK
ncbi:MAG TPA: helix-turn-helix domain-containing protein [Candidatus Merdenecus merdavium]|nr:helix-turn-helix domain-containing protein [Candidatus Merdenecus merdavium]